MHLQTPLTEVEPAGQAVVHLPFKRLKPGKQAVHDSKVVQFEHG